MEQIKLDTLDEKILAELDNNARQSNSEIAKKLRINKNVVNYRIKNLEQSGVITGYYTVIDNYKLGYSSYRVYLKLQYASPDKEKEIMDYLVTLPQTWWIGTIKGYFTIGALFGVKSQNEFVAAWKNFNMKFRDHVEESKVVIYYGLEHYRLPFTKKYLGEKANIEYVGVGDRVKVDNIDIALLHAISNNGRLSLLEIAKKLKLTPAAIQYRIKQLIKKNVILGFRAIVDSAKLGYTLYKMDFNLKDVSAYDSMEKFAREHFDIFYLDKTIGWADIEIDTYAKSPARLYEIMEEIRSKFSDKIRSYGFFTYSEITKVKYMPEI